MRRKRNSRQKGKRMRVIRLWTYPQAQKALPYIRSIATSLRQHWVDLQGSKSRLHRLEKQAGRPDKASLMASQEAEEQLTHAESRFAEELEELMKMDVFLLDPAGGVALIPFSKEDNLAWFVFDLFDEDGLKTWRFHEDPMAQRRPIEDALTAPKDNPVNL